MDNGNSEIERSRLDFDIQKHEDDLELRKNELAQRQLEFNKRFLNPSSIAIVIAIIGLLGTAIGALLQGETDRSLQKDEHDTEIIISGLSLSTAEKRKEYLHFAADLGLLNSRRLSSDILSTIKFPEGPKKVSSEFYDTNTITVHQDDISFPNGSEFDWSEGHVIYLVKYAISKMGLEYILPTEYRNFGVNEIVDGNSYSKVAYIETTSGYFMLSEDMMLHINITYSRWD